MNTNSTVQTTTVQYKISCFHNRKKKIQCMILSIFLGMFILIGIIVPVIIVGKFSEITVQSTFMTTRTMELSTTKQTSTTRGIITPQPTTTKPTILSTTTPKRVLIPLYTVNGSIMGIYNTTIGGNSLPSTPGFETGQYPPKLKPHNVCDGDISTKYQNFGHCSVTFMNGTCGSGTGLYFELERSTMIVTALRICVDKKRPPREPKTVSLEGSNLSRGALTFGTSWTLLYNGATGFTSDYLRDECGPLQSFSNSVPYKSYRFLVSSTNINTDSTEYSDLELYEDELLHTNGSS
ncbi:hypothetical protein I4U23_015482 [Adineta vaga]|nr:hypothetical protein I4U23_015482 [Adineta vaga]